jgi:hypothetical protein
MVKLDWAKKEEPYWWVEDGFDCKHKLWLCFMTVTKDEYPDYLGYVLIIGRLRLAYFKEIKNEK